MHIAFTSPSWPPQRFPNGVVTYVNSMRNELMKLGHRVSVFTAKWDGDTSLEPGVYKIEPSDLRLWLLKMDARFRRREPWIFSCGRPIAESVAAVHRTDPIDILETEESFGWMGDVIRMAKLPVVVKLHGPAFLTTSKEELATVLFQQKVQKEGEALARCAAIISPSRFVLDNTLARYQLKPFIGEHIVNPVSLDPKCPMWSLDRCSRQTVLFVGRFDLLKGADLMLLAFRKLLTRWPELKLVFVGPDIGISRPDGARLHFQEFVSEHFSPSQLASIDYKGKLPPEAIGPLRTRALLTVVASRFENQSYTALEAMLQGCPVVSTGAGGQPEVIKHQVSGLLAKQNDVDDLALQISRMLEDPIAAAAMGQCARQYVQDVHCPSTVAATTLGVYRRMLKGRS